MSVEKILERIEAETEEEISTIKREADDTIHTLSLAGRDAADVISARMIQDAGRSIKQNQSEERSRFRIEARERVRVVKELLIAETFVMAAEKLQSVRFLSDYPNILENLIRNGAMDLSSEEIVISVSVEDTDLVTAIIPELKKEGIDATISDKNIICSGGAVISRSSGLVSIDNTVEGRFERMKKDLMIGVSQILLREGDSGNG